MFASSFLEPETTYIKDAKTNEEIPIPKLNKCGMIVYFIAVSVGLITFICYLALPAFETQLTTIGNTFIKGQNCSILSTFSGSEILGLTIDQRVLLTYALTDSDEFKISTCATQTCTVKGQAFEIPSEGMCWDTSKLTGGDIQNSYGHTTTVGGMPDLDACNLGADTPAYTSFDDCVNKNSFDNPTLAKKALKVYGSNGIMFDFNDAKTSNIPADKRIAGKGTTWIAPKSRIAGGYDGTYFASYPMLIMGNSYQSVYYPSEQTCLENLKLVSADMVELEKNIYFQGPTSSGGIFGGNIADNLKVTGGCYIPVQFRQIDFKFSVPGFKFSLGPSIGNSFWYSNLVCSQNADKKADKCGYITPGTQDYNPQDAMELFEMLYPDWTAKACSVFKDLSPVQCIKTESPSVVTAAANSLALFNSLLGGLFLVACYLMSNGYDVYSYLFDGKKKAVDAATASDGKSKDTETKAGVELSTQSNPVSEA